MDLETFKIILIVMLIAMLLLTIKVWLLERELNKMAKLNGDFVDLIHKAMNAIFERFGYINEVLGIKEEDEND